ncbi:hypothetical protein SEVIR_1G090500v4 [Setaria viridis]
MGMRDKKRNQKRVLAQRTAAPRPGEGKDFLPLEGGPGKRLRKVQQPEEPENTATVVYIGHIPHGFYEDQMQGFFKQFGDIKRLRIARNRKTGKSKHYGFIEFESPLVSASFYTSLQLIYAVCQLLMILGMSFGVSGGEGCS